MLTSGHLLAERYRLDWRIAVGGMGEVWQAVDVRLDRTVAVKVLKPELCGDAEFLHRFRTEARTTASLNHPGIAAVHDYGETSATAEGPEDTAYLVMELVEGEPLATILAREGRITVEHTLEMLEQAGSALQAAHERGLVHRDVKPGNILVTPSGTVKLTDFGIAKAADAAPVTRSGTVMGTAHYISPEQALGSEAIPASDVYSLAVVGYECLKGHRPFLSDNAVTVAMMHIREVAPLLPPDIPRHVRALIEATLVKDPRYRYSSGGEFANAVASVRAGGPLPAPAALAAVPSQQQPQQQLQQGNTVVHEVGPPRPSGGRGMPQHPPAAGMVVPSPPPSLPAAAPPSVGVPPTSGGMQHPGNAYPSGAIPPQGGASRTGPLQAASPMLRSERANRGGLWVFLVVVIIVVLAVTSAAAWRVLTQNRSLPKAAVSERPAAAFAEDRDRSARPDADVRFIDLDSVEHLVQTALRHHESSRDIHAVGNAARPAHARIPHPGQPIRHRQETGRPVWLPVAGSPAMELPVTKQPPADRRTAHVDEVGGTAHCAPAGQRAVEGTSAATEMRVSMMGRPWTRIGTTQR
ncbi:serine/threonine-protein kinase [Halopolyspora algeriensis]|uniref:non-specific serine/threonine protein kinase n=1 Tax=Halopolyspora algeriensis TaxID=1500506 RepID=A0A368VZC6_9ACTN|nr:serine/threonine-protein kinase [Halopolyspora algeriensis]RCW47255.1 serine/threonine-protein kinase [Halopolyspora algeriensis]TQM42491.1 serine/threonine-protein kinase [Halopolyspora algeriensis]